MNAQLYLTLFQLAAAGVRVAASPELADLRQHIEDLRSKLNAKLPQKPDGTPWTDAEIVEIADQARIGFIETLIREQGHV